MAIHGTTAITTDELRRTIGQIEATADGAADQIARIAQLYLACRQQNNQSDNQLLADAVDRILSLAEALRNDICVIVQDALPPVQAAGHPGEGRAQTGKAFQMRQ